ncbi:NADH dehydrogenase (ubiquinone) complex I, assembly factor 6 [Schistosoma japonicum]|uniref:NADH dehydrogenase (Ubiquinone) complex I, assembly factor 6 n=1 Tax=Schistosoma japonicum TaxID=6182 RepID=A0A4Z2D7C4_SCHJA|nr:NADH dehydrogenase (ubiquinone) complex I, assembly factor 6 [Schistosoma japonicum]
MPSIFAKTQPYCLNIVRKHDYENYLCSLLLPDSKCNFALAIRAFNVELAQVCERSKNFEQAKYRFQFWKNVIEYLFDSSKDLSYDTPLKRELKESASGLGLSKFRFYQLVNSREQHFNVSSFPTCKAAEAYFDDAYAPIHCLISEAYGFEMTQLNSLLSHLGRAQGLVNMLRSSVLLAQHKNILLFPLDLINQYNLTQEHVLHFLRNNSSITSLNDESVKSLICDIASLGHYHAKRVSQLSSELMAHSFSPSTFSSSKLKEKDLKQKDLIQYVLPRLLLPLLPVTKYLNYLGYSSNFDLRLNFKYHNGLLPLQLCWNAWWNKLPKEPKA